MDWVTAFYASHPFWVWLALGAVFLVIELATGSGWLLWPAGSAVAVALATLTGLLNPPLQLALFAVLTIVSTYVGRRWFIRPHATGPDINDQLGRLVGRHGEAAAAFERGEGRVFVDGKEWAAELDGDGALAGGARVEVTEVLGGARLKVRAA
ncbi:MAG TPA: NfeD family protein [Caulobacteraceae bacterium]|nr:NfeD family protein [Caulobacteraceae bacterium]